MYILIKLSCLEISTFYSTSALLHTLFKCETAFGDMWSARKSGELHLRLHYTRLFPDPRFLLFVLQNVAGYKNAVECLLQ